MPSLAHRYYSWRRGGCRSLVLAAKPVTVANEAKARLGKSWPGVGGRPEMKRVG